jgi:hypothetical protein
MKKSRKRVLSLSLCAAAAALVTGAALWYFGAGTQATGGTVSVGLQQLADRTYLAAAAPVGEAVVFGEAWFDEQLQGARVQAITVKTLPDVTDGELMLGAHEVEVGQRIERADFASLCFRPAVAGAESSFLFTAHTRSGESGYTLCCRLLQGESRNCCPAPKGSVMAVTTHEGLSVEGTLEAEDAEGQALHFEVVHYPKGGTLTLNGTDGRFCYLPTAGFSGEDHFTWRVQDAYGAFSEEQEVRISVQALSLGYVYSDVPSDRVHAAALTVTKHGLLGGEHLGGKHYFHPDRTLTRAAFVCILLEAAEIDYKEAEDTGYSDNAEIPRGMRGAIKHAREQGWLGEESAFRPGDAITRAEAASIACRVLGLSAPGYSDAVEDHGSIPVCVVDALYAVYEGGYLPAMADGSLSPASALTRGEAAEFFVQVMEK